MPRRPTAPTALAAAAAAALLAAAPGPAAADGTALAPAATPATAEGAPAAGNDVCVPDFKALASKLEASYAEVPVSAGLGQDGNLVSVFASPDTGTWTLVMTRPGGSSCVVAVGEAWRTNPAAAGPPV